MADAFDTAQQEIENQRRAAVAALAANGSAGAAALADANSQIGSLRGAALKAELANAAANGVPSAARAELGGIIQRPYDLLSASTAQMAASNAQRQAALSGAYGQYFPQLAAAVPISRINLKSKIDAINAQRAADAAAAQTNDLSDSELRVRLMGAGAGLRDQALGTHRGERDVGRDQRDALRTTLGDLRQKLAENRAHPKHAGGTTPGLKVLIQGVKEKLRSTKKGIREDKRNIGNLKATGTQRYAIRAGIASGLDENRVRGLIQVPSTKIKAAKIQPASQYRAVSDAAKRAGIRPKVLNRITKPSGADEDPTFFEGASNQARAAIKDGVPLSVFKKDMNQAVKGHGRTKALILAIYGPAFQK